VSNYYFISIYLHGVANVLMTISLWFWLSCIFRDPALYSCLDLVCCGSAYESAWWFIGNFEVWGLFLWIKLLLRLRPYVLQVLSPAYGAVLFKPVDTFAALFYLLRFEFITLQVSHLFDLLTWTALFEGFWLCKFDELFELFWLL